MGALAWARNPEPKTRTVPRRRQGSISGRFQVAPAGDGLPPSREHTAFYAMRREAPLDRPSRPLLARPAPRMGPRGAVAAGAVLPARRDGVSLRGRTRCAAVAARGRRGAVGWGVDVKRGGEGKGVCS